MRPVVIETASGKKVIKTEANRRVISPAPKITTTIGATAMTGIA